MTTSAHQDLLTQQRRLEILSLLAIDPDYKANDIMLHSLLKLRGHGVALAVVNADLAWLEQVGLLSMQELPGCKVAILRQQGKDVAEGSASVPGVARPGPGN